MPPTHRVEQSTLIPAATPPAAPTFESTVDVQLGTSTLAYLGDPERAPNSEAGLYLPRVQLDGSLGLRVHRRVGLRLLWREALGRGSLSATPTELPRPGGNAHGFGVGFSFRAGGFGEPWWLDLSFDWLGFSLPSFVRVTCVDESCAGEPPLETQERSGAPVFSASAIVGHPIGDASHSLEPSPCRTT